MNSQEFRASIEALHERLVSLTATKGEEYKRRDDNQFANFERGAQALGLIREQVLMVYLAKHLDSITTWVRDLSRRDAREYAEPITGRIDDAILYLLLLRGMAEEFRAAVAEGVGRSAADCGTQDEAHHWLLVDGAVIAPAATPAAEPPAPHVVVCRTPYRASLAMAAHDLRCQHVTHPDSLHGIPAGSAVWLVREDGDGHFADEVARAAAKRSLVLYFVTGTAVSLAGAAS